ncbi:hypothetical protein CBS101457_004238 [Exobasidium rhododendri]|nr:hypothetical protein CBS101457_004238 [Exobasidium rhododendri]
MAYRLEYASSGRAACKGPEPCKGTKIEKASLRFGTVVDISGHTSFHWRHWGCVTRKQLSNIKEKVGEAEDLDGYEDLREEDQKRVEDAIMEGKVAPEDVTPGMEEEEKDGSPKKKPRRSKKKVEEEEEEEEEEDEEVEEEDGDYGDEKPQVKHKKGRKSKKAEEEEEYDGGSVKQEDDFEAPVKVKRARKSKKAKEEEVHDEESVKQENSTDAPSASKKARKPSGRKGKTDDSSEVDAAQTSAVKAEDGDEEVRKVMSTEKKTKKKRSQSTQTQEAANGFAAEKDEPVAKRGKGGKKKVEPIQKDGAVSESETKKEQLHESEASGSIPAKRGRGRPKKSL